MASPLHYILLLSFLAALAGAQVPASQTFFISNWGNLESDTGEYDATYRVIKGGAQSFSTPPFRLCFYNTTANAAVLAIVAGVPDDISPVRFVWEANRNRPVPDTAVLSFRSNGNLQLSGADGFTVWQTNTANKGVVGIKLLPNGNLVLHDKNMKFIWQSFDHPTDTLLVGQSLKLNGPNKLVSRSSEMTSSDGQYTIVFNKDGFLTYINKTGQPIKYGGWAGNDFGSMITFKAVPEFDAVTESELIIAVNETLPQVGRNGRKLLQLPPTQVENNIILNKLSYNASYSFFRIGHDGNLRVFTYHDTVSSLRWRESFAYFSDYYVSKCQLPTHCGDFGVCDRGMCVACPTARGLVGWTENCTAPAVPPCGNRKTNSTVEYYKIVGVGHFLNAFVQNGDNPTVSVQECRNRCSRDCKCVGFMYDEEDSTCMVVPYLGALVKVTGADSMVAYVKYAK